jgi:hypothetical protein
LSYTYSLGGNCYIVIQNGITNRSLLNYKFIIYGRNFKILIKKSPVLEESPRAEVGEIDTRAPFASVKAVVSLFDSSSIKEEMTEWRDKILSYKDLTNFRILLFIRGDDGGDDGWCSVLKLWNSKRIIFDDYLYCFDKK